MKSFDFPQYSPSWWAVRRGVPTASEFKRIVTPAKWQMGIGAETYACELIGQLFDPHYGVVSDFATTAMKNGTIMEPESRRFYEFETGREVTQVGFCLSDCGRFGCSPDGLVGDDGGLELKHPTAATQVKWLKEGGIPSEHLAQCLGGILVTRRKWWDFLSYFPGMQPLLVRVVPDERLTKLAGALEEFWKMLTEIRQKISGGVDTVASLREPFTSPF